MFALVGTEEFRFGPSNKYYGRLDIDNGPDLDFVYKLEINGKPMEVFREHIKIAMRSWKFPSADGVEHLLTLGLFAFLLALSDVVFAICARYVSAV
jgi:hypothetical protein